MKLFHHTCGEIIAKQQELSINTTRKDESFVHHSHAAYLYAAFHFTHLARVGGQGYSRIQIMVPELNFAVIMRQAFYIINDSYHFKATC